MRTLLTGLLFALVVSSTQAGELGAGVYSDLMEFDEAYALHNTGNFERARAGFRHLAELGDPQARPTRRPVAVMVRWRCR